MATVAEACKACNLFAVLLFVFLAGACGKSAESPEEDSMLARIEALEKELRDLKDVPRVPYWQFQQAQAHEFGFWKREGEEVARDSLDKSEWLMGRFHFEKDSFKDQVVVDIGCGPSGRLDWLDGSFLAIEPLVAQYRKLPWARLDKYHKIYDRPAEIRIEELVGAVDMIFAINSLDHAFDVELILANMFMYLKPGGRAFISVDVNVPSGIDLEHPLKLGQETMYAYLLKHGFEIEREEHGRCSPDRESWGRDRAYHWCRPDSDSWGRGTAYHWWLRKPASGNGSGNGSGDSESGEPG